MSDMNVNDSDNSNPKGVPVQYGDFSHNRTPSGTVSPLRSASSYQRLEEGRINDAKKYSAQEQPVRFPVAQPAWQQSQTSGWTNVPGGISNPEWQDAVQYTNPEGSPTYYSSSQSASQPVQTSGWTNVPEGRMSNSQPQQPIDYSSHSTTYPQAANMGSNIYSYPQQQSTSPLPQSTQNWGSEQRRSVGRRPPPSRPTEDFGSSYAPGQAR